MHLPEKIGYLNIFPLLAVTYLKKMGYLNIFPPRFEFSAPPTPKNNYVIISRYIVSYKSEK